MSPKTSGPSPSKPSSPLHSIPTIAKARSDSSKQLQALENELNLSLLNHAQNDVNSVDAALAKALRLLDASLKGLQRSERALHQCVQQAERTADANVKNVLHKLLTKRPEDNPTSDD